MNVQRVKSLVWLGSFASAGYLGWFVWDFLDRRADLEQGVSTEEQLEVLQAVEAPPQAKDEVVDYQKVELVYHGMNWTGKVEQRAAVTEQPVEPPKPTLRPVAELLEVYLIQVDTDAPEGSLAYVAFLDPKLSANAKLPTDRVLKHGDKLKPPFETIVVDSIRPDGVLFRFEGGERAAELVAPLPYPDVAMIVQAGPGGAIEAAPRGTAIPRVDRENWNTRETMQVGANAFRIGTDTAREVGEDYSRILAQDLQYTKHKNPTTGQVEGLRITKIAANSVPEAHGFQEGEVIKSINGFKVTSVNSAVAYVKQQASTTSVWEVVIERQGREYTRIFHSPVE